MQDYTMSESKSLLARLLAKENITICHGNYNTAYFDVQNRVLGLPLWKDDDKDLYDMLVGHEVGHALYTPAEGWVGMQSKDNESSVPGDYLNVVEDIRIERMIQKTYPGMVRSFKKGYSYLNKTDFFGIGDRDVNNMGLMDRINLKAKLRDLIDVEFSDEEIPLVNRAFAADTWDEVVESARELYEFVKSNSRSQKQDPAAVEISQEGLIPEQQQQDEDEENDPTSGSFNDDFENGMEESDDQEDEESDLSTMDSDSDPSDEQGTESDLYESIQEEQDEDLETVETQRKAQENAEKLLETNENGKVPLVVNGLSREQMKDIVVPFDKVRKSREMAREKYIIDVNKHFDDKNDSQYINTMKKLNTDAQFKEFLSETKRVVNVMVKEFELRKAAHQYSRASTARSGSLDLQRLHEYKTNDDIFKRVTTLADAKSHGMVMLVDNSGSMSDARGPVITQVLNLAMFCKRVNIPFDVYSFTTNSISFINQTEYHVDDDINHASICMTHMLSSSFSRSDYDVAYRQLYDIAIHTSGSNGEYDKMRGTPLNDILTGMHVLLKDFKNRHGIEKTIFTVLTDGMSNMLNINTKLMNKNIDKRHRGVRILLDESKQMIRANTSYYFNSCRMTEILLNAIRKEIQGLTTVGYFVSNSSSEFKDAVKRASTEHTHEDVKSARKLANINKFVSYDDVIGYDRYFILNASRARDLHAYDDQFEVSKNAKRGEIARAFKKYSKSKKGNRVIATQFAEIVS